MVAIVMGLIVLIHVSTGRVHVTRCSTCSDAASIRLGPAAPRSSRRPLRREQMVGARPCVQVGASLLVEKAPAEAGQ